MIFFLDWKTLKPRKWGFGEPSSSLYRSCAVMSTDTMTLKAVPCGHSHMFLCQKQGILFQHVSLSCDNNLARLALLLYETLIKINENIAFK